MNSDKEGFHLFDILIFVLSIYVLVALAISVLCNIPPEISKLMDYIDDVICLFFLYDFVINLIHAPNKWKYMKWGWIDLISSIPAIGFLRVGRMFRLIRIFRLLRAYRSTEILVHYIFKSKIRGTMMSVLIITILLIIFSSITVLIVENKPDCNIKTAGDAIWWTMETITTVGYGDKYPITVEGRIIGMILMVSGTGLYGVFTAYVASLFIDGGKKKEK